MSPRLAMYQEVLYELRVLMIERMAKPEEVIVVVDENNNVVREQTKDTEVLAQYKVSPSLKRRDRSRTEK
jgi:exportin-1